MSRSICPLPLPMITLLAAVVLCFAPPTLVNGQDFQVTSTPVGDPTWSDTDFHLFSAPADTFDAFQGVISSVWPLHGVGGGEYTPHEPPYDMESAEGVAANGFVDTSTFQVEEISGDPLGVYFLWTTLPNLDGPTGSSEDFASGPIIPNDVLPIAFSAEMLHGGGAVDSANISVEDADGLDGRSHVVSVFGTAAFFFPEGTELLGDYEFQLSSRDAAGTGWDHSVSFEVIPEPSTAALSLVGCLSVLALRRKRA